MKKALGPDPTTFLARSATPSWRARIGFLALGLASLLPLLIPRASRAADTVALQTFGTHSRLSIAVDPESKVQFRETSGGFTLEIPGASLVDLGAPIGSEAAWAASLGRARKDARLAGLTFHESPQGVKIEGKWNFGSGDNAPARPVMERFEYRMKAPSRYVIDFWVKAGQTVREARAAAKIKGKQDDLERRKRDAEEREKRRLAAAAAQAEREDVALFCRGPLTEENAVFLPFHAAHEPLDLARWIPTQTPDADYHYLEPIGDAKDSQYFRLALALYRDGKHALAIKTLDFLEAEVPDSLAMSDAKFLRANALWRLELEEQSLALLSELAVTAKDRPVALQSVLFLAARNTQRKQHLAALENFLWLTQRYPQHRLAWLFHLGAAENLYLLKQTDRAAKEYEWVATRARATSERAEAAFRQGDVYFARRQYELAVTSYFQAMQKFPTEKAKFPLVHLNRAEALYWLGQFKPSSQGFSEFLKQFPGHPEGWRAAYRIGEIAMRSNDAAERERGRASMLAAINQYPLTPGATLARQQLAPCGDHGGLDAASVSRFFEGEALELPAKAEASIRLDGYADFRALAYVRSLMVMGEIDRGIAVGISELQKNPNGPSREILGGTLRALFRKSIREKLASGLKFEALKFYEDRAALVPRSREAQSPEELDYLLELSRAASDLGLGSVGMRLAEDYRTRSAAEESRAPASATGLAREEAERRKSGVAFTEAKAFWVKFGMEKEAEIRSRLSAIPEESQYSGEKEILLALIDESQGRAVDALKRAVRAQMLHPTLRKSPRLAAWIAGLQDKVGQPQAAAEGYRALSAGLKKGDERPADAVGDPLVELGLPLSPTLEQLLFREAELLSRQNRHAAAAAVYERAVESGAGGNQALYEFARTLRRTGQPGDLARSEDAMQKLSKSPTDDFWKKLALRSTTAKEGESR